MMQCQSVYLEKYERKKTLKKGCTLFTLGSFCSFLWLQLTALQGVHSFGPEGLFALLKDTLAEVKRSLLKSVVVCSTYLAV